MLLGQLGVAELAGTVGGDFTGSPLVRHHHELVASLRHFGQTLNFDRNRWPGRLDGLAIFVQHGAHPAISGACQHDVTGFECAGLDQHRGDGTAAFVKLCFDHQALGHGVYRGPQLENLGLQEHLLEQVVNALTGFGRHRHKRRFATELFWHDLFDDQLVLDAFGVGIGFVNLVDRHHDGYPSSFGVFDRLAGLWHDAVVGCHHQNHNVRCFGAASTHRGEGLVARGIQE